MNHIIQAMKTYFSRSTTILHLHANCVIQVITANVFENINYISHVQFHTYM